MSAIFKFQGKTLSLGTLSAPISSTEVPPDLAGLTLGAPNVQVFLGELKVPWRPEQSLTRAAKDQIATKAKKIAASIKHARGGSKADNFYYVLRGCWHAIWPRLINR
jgi:hypothetical protein